MVVALGSANVTTAGCAHLTRPAAPTTAATTTAATTAAAAAATTSGGELPAQHPSMGHERLGSVPGSRHLGRCARAGARKRPGASQTHTSHACFHSLRPDAVRAAIAVAVAVAVLGWVLVSGTAQIQCMCGRCVCEGGGVSCNIFCLYRVSTFKPKAHVSYMYFYRAGCTRVSFLLLLEVQLLRLLQSAPTEQSAPTHSLTRPPIHPLTQPPTHAPTGVATRPLPATALCGIHASYSSV